MTPFLHTHPFLWLRYMCTIIGHTYQDHTKTDKCTSTHMYAWVHSSTQPHDYGSFSLISVPNILYYKERLVVLTSRWNTLVIVLIALSPFSWHKLKILLLMWDEIWCRQDSRCYNSSKYGNKHSHTPSPLAPPLAQPLLWSWPVNQKQ